MSKDGQTIPDDRPPSPQERGEILAGIKRRALKGYRQEMRGDGGFEERRREAFFADEGGRVPNDGGV